MNVSIHNPKVHIERFSTFDAICLSDNEGQITIYVNRTYGNPSTQFAGAILNADVTGRN